MSERITITLDKKILDKIDEIKEIQKRNRSNLIQFILSEYFKIEKPEVSN